MELSISTLQENKTPRRYFLMGGNICLQHVEMYVFFKIV